jgi:hypothetical protein
MASTKKVRKSNFSLVIETNSHMLGERFTGNRRQLVDKRFIGG